MTELIPNSQSQPQATDETIASAPETEVSAGQALRQAREHAGLHIAALAVALKVPTRKIEALEADRYDELPGITFTRALASSICRHLKVNPADVLDKLPTTAPAKLATTDDGVNTPFHKPGDLVTLGETWQKLRITVISVLALLLGSVLLYSLPQAWLSTQSAKEIQLVVSPKISPSAPATTLPSPVPESSAPLASASQTTSITEPPSVTNTSIQSSSAGTASAVSSPVGLSTGGSYSGTGTATSIVKSAGVASSLTFKMSSTNLAASNTADFVVVEARGDTWVEVTDKDSQLLIRRVLKAGEKQPISGKTPLMVVVGNADKTRISVRGKPFDLSQVTKENVARFSVN